MKDLYYIDEMNAYVELDKVKTATIQDMLDVEYTYDDCAVEKIDENLDDQESLWKVDFYSEPMTYEEMLETECDDLYCISYWDGNNWTKNVFENSQLLLMENCEIKKLDDPSPPYYFNYQITNDKEKIDIEVTQSNMSGSLSPFYFEDRNELY